MQSGFYKLSLSNRLLAVVLTLLVLSACGGNGAAGTTVNTDTAFTTDDALTARTNASLSVRQRLLSHMEDRYLWYQDLPSLDLTDNRYADLELLLEDLKKYPEDRFSTMYDATIQHQRIEEGVTVNFGLHFTRRENTAETDGLDLRIAGVDEYSSVGLAGIQRGDRIIGAQGIPIDDLGYDGFRDLFLESGLGLQRTLEIRHPDGREQSYNITRTRHLLSPVRKQTIFTHPDSGREVGYVLIEEFVSLTTDLLKQFRHDYGNRGLDDLIIDLRYNGGGLVSASRDLASTIYGQYQPGTVYTELQKNDKYENENFRYTYRRFENAFNSLDRVFILTTEATCSASEEVINGLKPFLDVITIGSTTCGKPYASRSYSLIPGLIDLNILDSRSVNALGEGDFISGFTPTCEAPDDPVLPYHDPQESLVSVALFYAENSRCPSG